MTGSPARPHRSPHRCVSTLFGGANDRARELRGGRQSATRAAARRHRFWIAPLEQSHHALPSIMSPDTSLSRVEAQHGDKISALSYFNLAVRNFHDSGNTTNMRSPLAALAAFFDRLGRYKAAATIAGFALSPRTAASFPNLNTTITHLRDVLGDQTYESLAGKGEAMTTAAMATYAYDQIDQTRTELNGVPK